MQAIGAAGLIAALAWWDRQDAPEPEAAGTQPAASLAVAVAAPRLGDASPLTGNPLLPGPAVDRPPAPGGWAPVTLIATSPQQLQVGEQNDMVVSLGPNTAVGEVSFTAHVDPNVLQVRFGTEGDWAAAISAAHAHFEADVPEAGDRVRIRSTVLAKPVRATAGGSVAIVQFQAVAPGVTTIRITDVAVKDFAGNSLPVRLSSATLHVTAESPSWPVTARPQGELLVQAQAPDAVEGD
jgi:hypothetical protein